jgi:hypothetical protein
MSDYDKWLKKYIPPPSTTGKDAYTEGWSDGSGRAWDIQQARIDVLEEEVEHLNLQLLILSVIKSPEVTP